MSRDSFHRLRPFKPAKFQVSTEERQSSIDKDQEFKADWVMVAIIALPLLYVLIAVIPRLFS